MWQTLVGFYVVTSKGSTQNRIAAKYNTLPGICMGVRNNLKTDLFCDYRISQS